MWQLNIHIPLYLGIKVRPAHVANHDAAPSSPLGMCGCMADYDSQCLKWRRCGVQGVVPPDVELSASRSRSIVGVCRISLVHSDLSNSEDFPSRVDLVGSGISLIHSELMEINHFKFASFSDEFGNELCIAHIIPCGLVSYPPLKDSPSISAFSNVTPIRGRLPRTS